MTTEEPNAPVGVELLMSPARRRVMDVLVAHARQVRDAPGAETAAPGLTAAELAEELDLHVSTVRFHLDQLLAADLLTTHDRRGPRVGRPRRIYQVREVSLREALGPQGRQARAFELLAGLLARHWDGPQGPAPSAEEAGHRWAVDHLAAEQPTEPAPTPASTPGQWLQKIGTAVDLLAEWGYTAEVHTSRDGLQASIRLVDCPFLSMARERPDVVCAVHRGLLDGAMTALGESADVSLEPFVTSRECLAHLTRQPPAPTSTERQ